MLIETPPQELLEQALSSPSGLAITLDSPYDAKRVRRRLYAEREKLRANGNNSYNILSFLIRNQCELWIIPRDKLIKPRGIECNGSRRLVQNELPSHILSRGKTRQNHRIS